MEQIKGSDQGEAGAFKPTNGRKFDQDFRYYSIYDRIHEVKEVPGILVVGDHDDPEVQHRRGEGVCCKPPKVN